MPHVRPSVHGPKKMFSNAFTLVRTAPSGIVSRVLAKSVRRGFAPSFSSHVRSSEPGFPVTQLRNRTACAAFREESRMQLDNATNFDRKSGERGVPSAGINRHIVGDERALRKRRSDSILTSSLALVSARRLSRSVDRGTGGRAIELRKCAIRVSTLWCLREGNTGEQRKFASCRWARRSRRTLHVRKQCAREPGDLQNVCASRPVREGEISKILACTFWRGRTAP